MSLKSTAMNQGKEKSWLQKYGFVSVVVIADIVLTLLKPTWGFTSLSTAWEYLVEILIIMPPIFVLMGLLDAWVPRAIVEKHVGPDSGWRGILISILVATAAAGPLYAAFPVAETLRQKGAKTSNIIIFLNTWAAIKIPMITLEIKYLGLPFALTRLGLTLPAVIIIGYLVERLCKNTAAMPELVKKAT